MLLSQIPKHVVRVFSSNFFCNVLKPSAVCSVNLVLCVYMLNVKLRTRNKISELTVLHVTWQATDGKV